MSAKIKQKNPQAIKNVLKRYKSAKVAIGFPGGTDAVGLRYPDGTSLLDVAVWNNYGTENIPRRDFMTPAGEEAVEKTKPINRAAAKAINAGTIDVEAVLNQMGAVGAAAVSNAITNLKDPPNDPATIAAKKSSNPLVDTGLLAQSPTWALREE